MIQTLFQSHENNNLSPIYFDKMNKFDGTNFDFYLLLPIKMADKMTKI
jgi:hypothetical protein